MPQYYPFKGYSVNKTTPSRPPICHKRIMALQKSLQGSKVRTMKRPSKTAKRILVAMAVIVAAMAAATGTFLLTARRFVVVSDAAWSLVMPKREFSRMRFALASKWYRLIILQPDASVFADSQSLESFMYDLNDEVGDGVVLLGPLASSKVVEYNVETSSILEDAAVYGIYGEGSALFDATLIPNPESGWMSAATEMAKKASSMSQNIAIVSDSKGSVYNETIKSQFKTGMVNEYVNEDASRLFVSNTIQEMNRLGIVIGMCPHLEGFYNVFDMDDTISWIVDYRYSTIVPSKQLYGTVLPDLSGLAKTIPLEKETFRAETAETVDRTFELEFKYDGK